MKKSQRKILTALLGLIAAAAGGWAVHVGLSYQDNSIRATNGGVVIQGSQGSPATHTGTGDVSQGVQHKGKGDIHIQIGISLKEYKADLKEREQEVRKELKQTQAEEREVLEKEKAEIERRLADTQASYRAYVEELEKRIVQLEAIRGQVPDALLDRARDALAQGDRSRADELFTRIEEQSTQAAAEAAYQRSQIALDEIRYRTAYQHAQRAVRLAPENSRYLTGAGELAQILGDYRAAKDYFEQALASDLKTHGKDHPDVATHRNNLGSAWESLGEYQKAIDYLEQALASDLKTYGEDHPNVAIRRSNLGSAWKSLGEYQKAIGYYEQALASDLKTYGEDHPMVALRRNNLGGVWYALGEYQKAIGYYEQALAIAECKLGPEHPNTQTFQKNLASAQAELKKADAAGRGQDP